MMIDNPEVLQTVVAGLQKGVPLKPRYVRLIRKEEAPSNYECGNCKENFVVRENKYCSECGQRLDWNGVED